MSKSDPLRGTWSVGKPRSYPNSGGPVYVQIADCNARDQPVRSNISIRLLIVQDAYQTEALAGVTYDQLCIGTDQIVAQFISLIRKQIAILAGHRRATALEYFVERKVGTHNCAGFRFDCIHGELEERFYTYTCPRFWQLYIQMYELSLASLSVYIDK